MDRNQEPHPIPSLPLPLTTNFSPPKRVATPKSRGILTQEQKATLHAQPSSAQTDRATNKKTKNRLVDVDVPPAQINLGQLNLFLQLVVRLGDVVERHDRHSQPAEQVASEGYQGVEGELSRIAR